MTSTPCIAHLRLALRHRRVIRITNLLERLVRDEQCRTKIIPHALGEWPVLKLMYAAVIRATDRWRGILVGEFVQRLSFAKISSHSVDDGPCPRDRARPGTLDSESEIARPTAWGRDEGKGPKVGGERPDPRVPSVVNGLGCVRPPVG